MPPTPSPNPVTLTTFNLRFSPNNIDSLLDQWPTRQHLVSHLLTTELQSGIIGTQEGLPTQLHSLLQLLPPRYKTIGIGRDSPNDHTPQHDSQGEHCAIIFDSHRLYSHHSGTFWYGPTPNQRTISWGAHLPRICTWSRFEILSRNNDDKPGNGTNVFLRIYNTHLDHESRQSRQNSIALLIETISAHDRDLGGKTDSVFVMGDFNNDSETSPEIEGMRKAGFVDTYRIIHRTGKDVNTYHGWKGDTRGVKIDFVWVRGEKRVEDAGICWWKSGEGRWPSDHFPVWTRIVV